MTDKPSSGEILGIPYNFERPSLRRLVDAHWEPGEGMLVEKPFGIGYTLNLASWRSWVVLTVAVALYLNESTSEAAEDVTAEEEGDEGPVEVVVD